MLMIESVYGKSAPKGKAHGDDRESDAKVVSGMPAHVMMFYCIWQTKLWPEWCMSGMSEDAALRQHTSALQSVSCNGFVTINNKGKEYREAFEAAVLACSLMGIDIRYLP